MLIRARLRTRDPDPSLGTDDIDASETLDVFGEVSYSATFRDGKARATATARVPFPYFGWIMRPGMAWELRRRLKQQVPALRASTEVPPPRFSGLMPPDNVTHAQIVTLATLSFVLVITGYCGGLFTQTVDSVAAAYGADDADLGIALAVTRAGTLLSLVGAILADKRGRRRIILAGVVGLALTTAAGAFAPNLTTFTVFQVLARGFVNLTAVVVFIAIIEEAPERARAFALALSLAAGGLGFGFGSALLVITDIGPQAFRILFLLGGLTLIFVPGIAKRLTETRRFADLTARNAHGHASEMVDNTYGRRFVILALVALLTNFAAAPTSQFFNRYLMNEREFTALGVLAYRATAQSIIPFIALLVGGRLAEKRGRTRTAQVALAIAVIADAVFFTAGGAAVLWFALLVSSTAGATGGPSLASFGNELFPTEVRGTANGVLLLLAVIGAVAGLLTAGFLSESLGGIGRAVALTDIAPFIVAVALIPFLPEARGRDLDDVSPSEV